MQQGSGLTLATIDANLLAEFDAENLLDNMLINLDPTKYQLVQGARIVVTYTSKGPLPQTLGSR